MTHRRMWLPRLALLTALCIAVPSVGVASAEEPELEGVPGRTASDLDPGSKVTPSLIGKQGRISVFVQTTGQGALAAKIQAEKTRSGVSAQRAAENRAQDIEDDTDSVQSAATSADPDAEILYTSKYTVPGVAVNMETSAVADLAQRDDVVKISPIVPRSLDLPEGDQPANGNSDALTKAVSAWQQTGNTGEGVNIAVIDTGLDYTHADFGGPGTAAAYQTALASTDAPADGSYDPAKYLGGYDFAGPTYNADPTSDDYQPVPAEDANPIDGPGGAHGTHVSGTAAGYGVTADGTTYTGGYGADELPVENVQNPDVFPVAPGSAPEAGLYSLKVFGDGGGSTDVTGAALEWVGEKVASGEADIDIINLSLGSDYGPADDPDNDKIAALADAGVLAVVAAGNAGDMTDVAGSPGTAERALTVAASSTGHSLADAVYVYDGDGEPTELASQYSQNFTGPTYPEPAPVVRLTDESNLDGCAPYSDQDAATVKGKVVLLAWDDADVACGSGTRFNNASAAGAVGVLLESQLNSFEAGIAGNSDIPGAQLTADSLAAFEDRWEANPDLEVAFDPAGIGTIATYDGTAVDTLASFSSRGVHGSVEGVVKPDVTAPGVNVISAGAGSGTGAAMMSGTSMATPHTAGIAALVAESHPDWSPDDVKAGIINTAAHDVTNGSESPIAYGPLRAGTGRVDALYAVKSTVRAASADNGNLVTASFGVVQAGTEPITQTRTVTVTNDGAVDAAFLVDYSPRVATDGVSFTVDKGRVTVPAHGTSDITVTLSIPDPTALRRTIDPTMEIEQAGVGRNYVTDASGVLELRPTDNASQTVRVAVLAAPEPVSDTDVTSVEFADPEATDGTLTVTGRGVSQGQGQDAYESLMVPTILGATDPAEDFPDDSAIQTLAGLDVRAIGASTTAPQLKDPSKGMLSFAVVTDGDTQGVSPMGYPVVSIDVDQDGRTDYQTFSQPVSETEDVPVAITTDLEGNVVDLQPIDGRFGDVDTNVSDTDVLALPVSLAALGLTDDSKPTPVSYSVSTESYFAPGFLTTGDPVVDETDTATIDVFHPAVWFGDGGADEGSVLFEDAAGTLPAHRTISAPQAAMAAGGKAKGADAAPEVLILHLRSGAEDQSETVELTNAKDEQPEPTPDPTDPEPSPEPTDPEPSPDPTSPAPGGDETPIEGDPSADVPGRTKLPRTGADVELMVLAALILIGSGTALVQWRRKSAQNR